MIWMSLVLIILWMPLLLLWMLGPNKPRLFLMKPFEKTYIAHRGLHDASNGIPENSLTAFRRAVDAGYGIELDLQLCRLEQKRADIDARGIVPFQRIEHVSHCETRIDNILYDDDGAVGDVDVQSDYFANAASRVRALIGCKLDERNLAWQVNLPKEVGSKDKRAVQYCEEYRLTTSIVAAYLFGYALYLLFNL